MKTYKEILEDKLNILKVKLYYSVKEYDSLFTKSNKSEYPLNKDKSVFFTDDIKDLDDLTIDGKPKGKTTSYDVMDVNGNLGIYNQNLKLVMKFKNMNDLVKNIENFDEDLDNFDLK